MRKSDTREIDGLSFTVQQMPVKRALKLMHRLARAGVPAILEAVGSSELKGALKLEQLDLSNLGTAATMLFDKFSEADFELAMRELLESATVEFDGKTLPALQALDVAITNPSTVLKAMGFALEVNYGDFSSAFRAAAGTLALKAAPQSKA